MLIEDFIVLIYWCQNLAFVDYKRKCWDVIDFFCGEGKIARCAVRLGYQAAAYDINLAPAKKKRRSIWRPTPSPMDINSDVGFTLLRPTN